MWSGAVSTDDNADAGDNDDNDNNNDNDQSRLYRLIFAYANEPKMEWNNLYLHRPVQN